MLGAAAIAQQAPYATHDWTSSVAGEGGQFPEAWVDVKAPGDGWQYAVGTIEVRDTGPGALFSNAPAVVASTLPTFLLAAPNRRQVVMLQITSTATQGIDRQRYFYGVTPLDDDRASNARGISVWPALDRAGTRIAICGETYDQALPLSQASFGAATTLAPTGFIAVFDGLGTLLWTHHAFGVDPSQSCAITDVSIRVDAEGRDVVTYCGISSHGVPGALTPLSPVAAYAPLFPGESGGATQQGAGQWDGIVGRVSRTAAGVQTIEFHSIVGGPEQDGLFGIAEIEADRFTVVGGTQWAGAGPPPVGFAFPGLGGLPSPFAVGVAMVFGSTLGPWVLESMSPIGNTGEVSTLARDVLVLRDGWAITDGSGNAVPALHTIAVVGSTSDPAAFAGLPQPPIPAIQGPTDGFVTILLDIPNTLTMQLGRYHGGPGSDGLTGVQGWNEYADHLVVTGFTEGLGVPGFGPPGGLDIAVESFYISTDTVGPLPPAAIRSLRFSRVGGSSVDRPAAMGQLNAMTAGLPFATGPLGEPAGGGIAVDERSRVNVVGQTLSTDFYVMGGRAYDASLDAVRTVFDMIPPGVGRTDGTGFQGGFVLPAGFTGGTTPPCALTPFGKLIGMAAPPAVPRMLIEYEGPPPVAGATGAAILVIRPTAPIVPGALASSAIVAGFQFDFPGIPAPAVQLPEGVELYTTSGTAVITSAVFGFPNQSLVIPLLPLPVPPVVGQPMTVQVVCVVPATVPGGIGAVCTMASIFTGTPAIWLPL